MTKAMPFLQKYDITFLRPPTICRGIFIAWGNVLPFGGALQRGEDRATGDPRAAGIRGRSPHRRLRRVPVPFAHGGGEAR